MTHVIHSIPPFFDKDSTVLNEPDILVGKGVVRRPDRVIIKEDKVSILDYKFGEKRKKHLYQVEEYKNKIDHEFSETYGMDISINVTQYDKIMIDGRPGLYIVYNYEFRDQTYNTIVVELYNGKESNIITFLEAPGHNWMEKYAESAKTIRYKDSLENGQ